MNITEILQPFSGVNPLPFAADELHEAIKNNDCALVDHLLTTAKKHVFTSENIVHFITHYTEHLADVFEKHGFKYAELPDVASLVEIPSTVWERAMRRNHKTRNEAWFNSATKTFNGNSHNSVQRWSALNLVQVHCAQHPKHIFQFLRNVGESFEKGFGGWTARELNYLKTFSQEQWLKVLDSDMCDKSLKGKPEKLKNLNSIFQHLPECAAAFTQQYTHINTQYQEIVHSFSSPAGIQGSVAYNRLSEIGKEDFVSYLEEQYGDPGISNHMAPTYKHLLGMNEEDFFLRRFERFDYDSLSQEIMKTNPNFNSIFHNQCALSALHALFENPETILTLDPKLGPQLAECLNDGVVMDQWLFHGDTANTIGETFKRFPDIVQWKDNKGNNIAHWYSVNQVFDENLLAVFCKHPSLMEPNHAGHTFRSILQHDVDNGMTDGEVLIALDRHILNSHISPFAVGAEKKRKM